MTVTLGDTVAFTAPAAQVRARNTTVTTPTGVARAENALGGHPERFGRRRTLTVTLTRSTADEGALR
jgi:hypothetical protein